MTLDPKLLDAYNATRHTTNKSVFCHAPFGSMNFSQSGDVTVCCYNREYKLGTYPADTLEQMWRGAQAEELRQRMSENRLPPGCDPCLDQFRAGNFEGLRARGFDHLAVEPSSRWSFTRQQQPFPKLMELEISNICNLECTMCNGFFSSAIRSNREQKPPMANPYDDEFVRQFDVFVPHLSEVRFLGGEPFLNRTYFQIWDSFVRLNPQAELRITTNGTVLHDRVKAVLDALRVHVIVSVDSLERDTYEAIRVHAKYDQLLKNLDYFREYTRRRGTEMTLAVCPMRQNWQDLAKLVEYCNARGIFVYFNTVWYPHDSTFKHMPYEMLQHVVEKMRGTRLSETDHVSKLNAMRFRDMVRQIAGDLELKAPAEPHGVVLDRHAWPSSGTQPVLEQVDASDTSVQVGAPVDLKAGARYVLTFRARANEFREVSVGIWADGFAEAPVSLGLFLRNDWMQFETDFVPDADAPAAQLYFALGADASPVEIADVSVRPAAHQ